MLVRPLREPRAGNQHANPDNPARNQPFPAFEDLPPLAGVKLVRPRRCAAAGAPALTPGRAAGRPGQLRGRIQKNSQPSPAARAVTGPDPYALLTPGALMGADESARAPHIVIGRLLTEFLY